MLFAGKAEDYASFRPDYSSAAIETLLARVRLGADDDVADLGSGTGLLTRHLLTRARRVYGIEPAEDMRRVAEARFGESFTSVAAVAERTTLPDNSIDVVTSGNAFHYFDPLATRAEVTRILRPGGRVAVLFHDRSADPGPFMKEYFALLESLTPPQLRAVHATHDHEKRLETFFGASAIRDEGEQRDAINWEQLLGRFASSSIAPGAGTSEYEVAVEILRDVFERHQRSGSVDYELRWVCVSLELSS